MLRAWPCIEAVKEEWYAQNWTPEQPPVSQMVVPAGKNSAYTVFGRPTASRVGAGRCPLVIWPRSSVWIVESAMVAPPAAGDGVMAVRPANEPRPMDWCVPPAVVSYSPSQDRYDESVT